MKEAVLYVLLGSACWAVETDSLGEKCANIYEHDKSTHISLESCLDRAEDLGTQIQLNLKKKGSYATEMTINCIPSDNSMTHGIVWK